MKPPADIRLSFDQVVETYELVRPPYPAALFDAIFAVLPANPTIVEVGPGTGQATSDLVDRGAHVTAVEIGANLAARMAENFAGRSVDVLHAPFEDASLAAHSFDAVFSATAYHWVHADQRTARPAAILKPGGWLAIVELIQVGGPSDLGYFDRVQPIYEAFGNDRHDWEPPTYETAVPAFIDAIGADAAFATPTVERVPWDQTYTAMQYRDLLQTYSGTRMMEPDRREDLVGQLVEVIDAEFGGEITRPLVATLTIAQRR